MKKTIQIFTAVSMVVFLALAPTAEAARRTEGTSWVNCKGRTTVGTVKWGTSKLTAYRCTNGYTFAHVSSGAKKLKRVSIENITPRSYTWQYNTGIAYAVTSNMTLLNNGHCYTAFGYTEENGSRKFSFCW